MDFLTLEFMMSYTSSPESAAKPESSHFGSKAIVQMHATLSWNISSALHTTSRIIKVLKPPASGLEQSSCLQCCRGVSANELLGPPV